MLFWYSIGTDRFCSYSISCYLNSGKDSSCSFKLIGFYPCASCWFSRKGDERVSPCAHTPSVLFFCACYRADMCVVCVLVILCLTTVEWYVTGTVPVPLVCACLCVWYCGSGLLDWVAWMVPYQYLFEYLSRCWPCYLTVMMLLWFCVDTSNLPDRDLMQNEFIRGLNCKL